MDTKGVFLRIERGQVNDEELATLTAVLLIRRRALTEPAASGAQWSWRPEANAPAGSWMRPRPPQLLPSS